MRRLRLAAALWALACVFNPPGSCAGVEGSLASELEELRLMRTRLIVNLEGARFLLVEERELEEVKDLRLGFASPLLTFGPLSPCGMLRQVFQPLGYGAGSGVWRENTDLRLDASFTGGSWKGVLVEAVPEALGLFLLRGRRRPLSYGGFLKLRAGKSLLLEALMVASNPPADGLAEDWFAPEPPFPGGRLLLLGGKLAFSAPPLGAFVLAARSSGAAVPQGGWALFGAAYERRGMMLDLLLGGCSREYRSPDGEASGDLFTAGLSLKLPLGETLRLGGKAQRTLGRPPALPRDLPPLREEACFLGQAALPLGRRWQMRLEAGAQLKREVAPSGRQETELTGELWGERRSEGPQADGTRFGAQPACAGSWGLGLSCRQAVAGWRLRENTVSLNGFYAWSEARFSWQLERSSAARSAASLRLEGELRRSKTRLYLRLGGGEQAASASPRFFLTLGWEARS